MLTIAQCNDSRSIATVYVSIIGLNIHLVHSVIQYLHLDKGVVHFCYSSLWLNAEIIENIVLFSPPNINEDS